MLKLLHLCKEYIVFNAGIVAVIPAVHANLDGSMESWLSPSEMEAALRLLHAITILTRSFHNRRIYSYFGGLQTLMGVMKCKFQTIAYTHWCWYLSIPISLLYRF